MMDEIRNDNNRSASTGDIRRSGIYLSFEFLIDILHVYGFRTRVVGVVGLCDDVQVTIFNLLKIASTFSIIAL